jgi:hypothetical protein
MLLAGQRYDPPNILYPGSIFHLSAFLAAGCSVAQFPFRWSVAPSYFTTRAASRSSLINVELCNAEETFPSNIETLNWTR